MPPILVFPCNLDTYYEIKPGPLMTRTEMEVAAERKKAVDPL